MHIRQARSQPLDRDSGKEQALLKASRDGVNPFDGLIPSVPLGDTANRAAPDFSQAEATGLAVGPQFRTVPTDSVTNCCTAIDATSWRRRKAEGKAEWRQSPLFVRYMPRRHPGEAQAGRAVCW